MSEYVFTPNADTGYVALSRTKSGRLVKKEILRAGPLHYPGVKGGKVELTNEKLDAIVKNFDSKVCDIVQFPLADGNNAHTEDPLRNGGEVVKLEHKGDSLFAYIDVRNGDVAKGIADKTIIGASAMLALDYTDTRTGQKAGPTLLHVAATNRPHVLELEDFEVITASVDTKGEAVLLTAPQDPKENPDMPTTKDELIAALKAEHDIDVQALLDAPTLPDDSAVAALTAQITEKLGSLDLIKLSNGDTAKAEDVVLAVGQLVEDNVSLSGRVEALELSSKQVIAEAEVDKLISDGFVPEKQREALVKLSMTDRETFDALVPDAPILNLSGEATGFAPADEKPSDVVQAEVDRYLDLGGSKAAA